MMKLLENKFKFYSNAKKICRIKPNIESGAFYILRK